VKREFNVTTYRPSGEHDRSRMAKHGPPNGTGSRFYSTSRKNPTPSRYQARPAGAFACLQHLNAGFSRNSSPAAYSGRMVSGEHFERSPVAEIRGRKRLQRDLLKRIVFEKVDQSGEMLSMRVSHFWTDTVSVWL
jgi:hypothetical protein